ncbi:MAG TPA: immune inhibitor A domain-containing protein [Actinoplanes sp.]|nr:immune inhibitor A domain-containing protein [Actinoplanes sp.]
MGLLGLSLAATSSIAWGTPAAARPSALPSSAVPAAGEPTHSADELPNPQEDKRRALRQEAIKEVISGRAKPVTRNGSTVVKVGSTATAEAATHADAQPPKDQYVELAREKTDKIFVILAEFGDERHPSYPDQDTAPATPGPVRFDGPLHNQIPQPDRSVDNSTVWQPNYDRAHFERLYFGTGAGDESLKQYYERQSSGRYSVDGMVTDWVKVRYNQARYGRSNGFPCAGNVCSNNWYLIQDAANQWVADRQAAGQTDEQIAAELAEYDVWDRYDYNDNGNFNEPDGYIDHFQIVHAGGDQADGDPIYGEDAIWSHRWKVFQNTGQGPADNEDGGTQIGNTGLWIADYTIQPENGGRSVFYHEYGHDLGLPDLYDTQGGGGDNAVGWWSIMAQSRLSAAEDEGIGTRGADLGPWEKIQLGWFDYEVALADRERTLNLGPHEYNSAKPQGVVVVLPKKEIVTELGAPAAGERQWWSGADDDVNNWMARDVTLPAGTAQLSFQARWNIEDCGPDPCDYAYVEVSTDDGANWTAIPGSITNAAEGNSIDGVQEEWTNATFDLSAYAGGTIGLRVRYQTDGAVQGNPDAEIQPGIFIDELTVTANGTTVFTDGAETPPNGWELRGFSSVAGSFTTLYDNYYIASNRAYVSYDRYLRTGPYNFGYLNTRPDWVDHFPYQDGLLIWYWDTSYSDNDVGLHPGEGEILPIDAHPRPIYNLQGQPWRGRIALYDATFTPQKADSFTLHVNSQPSYIRGQDGVRVFDDSRQYWYPETPTVGVKVPNTGTRIQVLSHDGTSMRIRIS